MNEEQQMVEKSSEHEDYKGAAVKFPPPLIFLIAIIVGYLLGTIWPIGLIDSVPIRYLGVTLCVLALFIVILLGLRFRRESTSIEPWKPTTKIMDTGIYAYSRNPIYLAFCIIVIGIGLALNNLWILISVIPAAFAVFHTAILKEEKYLEQKFKEQYREYKKKVRRWI